MDITEMFLSTVKINTLLYIDATECYTVRRKSMLLAYQ